MAGVAAKSIEILNSQGLLTATNVEDALMELAYAQYGLDRLLDAGGESVLDRDKQAACNVCVNQQLRLERFRPLRTERINNVELFGGGTAAGATPTLIRLGVWLRENDGTCNLVASIINDVTIFNTTTGSWVRALQAGWTKIRGRTYYVGVLVVTGAALPQMCGTGGIVAQATTQDVMLSKPITLGTIGGLNDLPSTFNESSMTATSAGGQFHCLFTP